MRVIGIIMGTSCLMIGGANASSFVAVSVPDQKISKSFVYVSAPVVNRPASSPMIQAGAESASAGLQLGGAVAKQNADRIAAGTTAPLVQLAFALPEEGGPVIRQVTPSIIAFEDGFPAVAFEKVAAIPAVASQPARRRPESVALLIRGGIVESGRPGSAAPVVLVSAKPPVSSPSRGNGSASRPGENGPPTEEPAPKIPPPPPPSMPQLRGPE